MDEFKKYEVIKALVDHPNANKDRAALTLGCTKRHIYRMMAGYCKDGKAFFLHGNKGRKPSTTIPDKTRSIVVDLYRTKYSEANFQHYTELLAEREGIYLSVSSVSKILEAEYILSPKATKAKRKRIKKNSLQKRSLPLPKRKRLPSRPISWRLRTHIPDAPDALISAKCSRWTLLLSNGSPDRSGTYTSRLMTPQAPSQALGLILRRL